jgi:hypothetical protein
VVGYPYISVSIGVPFAGGQQADRILGRVRFDEFEYSPEFGRLSAIPACGIDERLVDFLRGYGVGSYESKFDLNTLFSTQCLARLHVGRDPRLAFGRTLQKWIASWNNKPPGKGPFNDSRASQRAYAATSGVKRLGLGVLTANSGAHRFWIKLGYQKVNDHPARLYGRLMHTCTECQKIF